MKTHEFVSAVQDSARISDRDYAEQAVRATLNVLGQRLSTEAEDLGAQLPPELAEALPTHGSIDRFGRRSGWSTATCWTSCPATTPT